MSEEKRKISMLIPYKIRDGVIWVFLQKRTEDAPWFAGYFGFFGGGREGNETPEQTLLREITEELNFTPQGYRWFDTYDFDTRLKDAYVLEVDDNFENTVQVNEGEYGKFLSEKETLDHPKIGDEDKLVLREFYKKLKLINDSSY